MWHNLLELSDMIYGQTDALCCPTLKCYLKIASCGLSNLIDCNIFCQFSESQSSVVVYIEYSLEKQLRH